MPLCSAFTPCGQLELSSKPSMAESVYRAMVSNLGGQYDLTVGGHEEATVYARARSIARGMQAQRRAGNNALPLKCIELLPLQEAGYGIVPGETDTLLARQQALAAQMLISRGAVNENVEALLRAIVGADFVAYRMLLDSEVATWPADPSVGPGTFLREGGATQPKYVKFTDPVTTVGVPITVYYTALDTTQGPVVLAKGDVMTVQLENLGLSERVTVASVGSDAAGLWFTATFTNPHDIGASAIVGSVPVWISTRRFALIIVKTASALDAEKCRRIDEMMGRVARGVSTWAIVQPSSPGATTIGPFTLDSSPLGAVPVGTLDIIGSEPPVFAPAVPFNAPLAGGTTRTLYGRHLAGTTDVQVDGISVTFAWVDDHTITFTDAAHANGRTTMSVTNAAGTTTIDNAISFGLTITSINPTSGPAGGGTVVTVKGFGFLAAIDVTINGFSLAVWSIVDDNTIVCTTDGLAPGFYGLVVVDGTSTDTADFTAI